MNNRYSETLVVLDLPVSSHQDSQNTGGSPSQEVCVNKRGKTGLCNELPSLFNFALTLLVVLD